LHLASSEILFSSSYLMSALLHTLFLARDITHAV